MIQRESGPIVIESEFAPAPSVDDDALARLHMNLRGRRVETAVALTLPRDLRDARQAELPGRLASSILQWRVWYSHTESGSKVSGDAGDLAETVRSTQSRPDHLPDAVATLDSGARSAGAHLSANPGAIGAVAAAMGRPPSDEVAHMAALMVINAMVFHGRLTTKKKFPPEMGISTLPRRVPVNKIISDEAIEGLETSWTNILGIDYGKIFELPLGILRALPEPMPGPFVSACLRAATDLLKHPISGSHDIAGRVFNSLVEDRKFVAAFYTKIHVATLLAGLALDKSKWPDATWANPDALRDFTVFDPACGTGTLLMAAHSQILQNYRRTKESGSISDEGELHRIVVENTLHGADVVEAAAHITASTLASSATDVTFGSMNLHTVPLGEDPDDSSCIKVGSLDWLADGPVTALPSGPVLPSDGGAPRRKKVPRPKADLVIANPPYRRHNSGTGKGDQSTRVFGHLANQESVSNQLIGLLRGTPANLDAGLASAFILLAVRSAVPGGRIAFVVPSTMLAGSSWRKIRKMLADECQVEWVVSIHGSANESFSLDTKITESLLVAKKLCQDEQPSRRGIFVNLAIGPARVNEAVALSRQVGRLAQSARRLEGLPVGGTEILLGSDKWGEVIDAPIDSRPWNAAMWRSSVVGQYAWGLKCGKLWSSTGLEVCDEIPIAELDQVVKLGPYHLQIKGKKGVFDIHKGFSSSDQYPALWHVNSRVQRTILQDPDSRLIPKLGRDVRSVWARASRAQLSTDIRYTAQRIGAAITPRPTLGVGSWISVKPRIGDHTRRTMAEIALALWSNTSLGLLCFANHANRTQIGRGRGNKTMLRTLPALDVTRLCTPQLEAAESLYQDFRREELQQFYRLAVDEARIKLDERFLTEVLKLERAAVDSVARIRELLADEPSICGNKTPAPPRPAQDDMKGPLFVSPDWC